MTHNDTTTPNKRKMAQAIATWIEAANGRMDGAAALRKRVAWLDDQIALLGRDDRCTPPHIAGLTLWDLMGSQDALNVAAKAIDAKVETIRARSAQASVQA